MPVGFLPILPQKGPLLTNSHEVRAEHLPEGFVTSAQWKATAQEVVYQASD